MYTYTSTTDEFYIIDFDIINSAAPFSHRYADNYTRYTSPIHDVQLNCVKQSSNRLSGRPISGLFYVYSLATSGKADVFLLLIIIFTPASMHP